MGGGRGVLEANETVAAGLGVRVEGDLQGLDVTVAGEVLLELLGGELLGDASHKDVVVDDFLGVRSEQVVVEGKGTGGLAWGELEVAHLLAGKDELVLLGDLHDGGIEGTVKVASDLWNTCEDDSGLGLQDGGKLGARGFSLGQVVEVEVVLGTLGVVHNHFVLIFVFVVWDRVFCLCFFILKCCERVSEMLSFFGCIIK